MIVIYVDWEIEHLRINKEYNKNNTLNLLDTDLVKFKDYTIVAQSNTKTNDQKFETCLSQHPNK